MEAVSEKTTPRPKPRHVCKTLWLGLLFVLTVVVCRWSWRQILFAQMQGPLLSAVKANDTEVVRRFLDQGADPDTLVDYQPESLWEGLKRLLRGGKLEKQPTTVLMRAIDDHNTDIVRLLLEHGADVNRPGGRITLYRSPGMGLSFGSQAPVSTGGTALYRAAYMGASDCVKALIEHGADVNARDSLGLTPLYWALYFPQESDEDVRLLLERGADPNVRDAEGKTPLLLAAECLRPASGSLKLLLTHGADSNARDHQGRTALMSVARRLDLKSIQRLLQQGADINARDGEDHTALWYAVQNAIISGNAIREAEYRDHYHTTLQALLDSGADIGWKNRAGQTLLESIEWPDSPDLKPGFQTTRALLQQAAVRASRASKGAGH